MTTMTAWGAPPVFPIARALGEYARVFEHWRTVVSETARRTARGASIEALLADGIRAATVANWDGFGAHAVDRAAVANASWLLHSLHSGVPLPEVGVDPDGDVSMEWWRSRTSMLWIIVGAATISYVAAIGSDRYRGTVRSKGTVPHQVLDLAREVYRGAGSESDV